MTRLDALLTRRGALIAQLRSEREQIAAGLHVLHKPLKALDVVWSVGLWFRDRPLMAGLAAMAGAALAARKGAGVVRLAATAWQLWQLWKSHEARA